MFVYFLLVIISIIVIIIRIIGVSISTSISISFIVVIIIIIGIIIFLIITILIIMGALYEVPARSAGRPCRVGPSRRTASSDRPPRDPRQQKQQL